MSLGGGQYEKFDKTEPGVYNRTIVLGGDTATDGTGVVALALPMDWGPAVNIITKAEFGANPEIATGYARTAPQNLALREVFSHAGTAVIARTGGGEKAEAEGVGTAREAGAAGNNITVSVMNNINNEEYFDVDTYFSRRLVDTQTVPGVKKQVAVLTETDVNEGTAIDGMTVSHRVEDNTVTVTYTGLPEDAKVSVQLKLGTVIAALQPGRIDKEEADGRVTLTFGPEAPTAAPYSLLFRVTEQGQSIKTVKTIGFTAAVVESEEIAGADGAALTDNDFVVFSNTTIPANAGYVFTGGTTEQTLTAGDYVDALNRLEGRPFNYLVTDSEDDAIRALYTEFTRRNREDNGMYFQLVSYRNPADSEAVVSVYNDVIGGPESGLVYWTAGAMAGVDLAEELTNVRYDGELTVNDNLTQAKLRQLDAEGHFLFHRFGIEDTRTYTDINTLKTFTADKQKSARNNQVIRVVDYIYNSLNNVLASDYVGKTKNNPIGRGRIWSLCEEVLEDCVTNGIIEPFEDKQAQIRVTAVPGQPEAIQIQLMVVIAATGRVIYLNVNVEQRQIVE